MAYRIGSFNLQNLSESSVKRAKKFKEIAHIIKNERFDIIALQEVLSEAAVKELISNLGSYYWDYVYMQPCTYAGKAEGYAYIWDKRRFRLIRDEESPMIYNRYTLRHRPGSQGLIRPPMVARFTTEDVLSGPFMEFRLINTHIVFNKSSNYEDEIGSTELRRKEFEILSEDIYRLVSTKAYGDNRARYTILMGDYNLCLSSNGPKIKDTVEVSDSMILRTVQDKKSTVKKEASEVEGEALDVYSHDYDHFTYNRCYLEKMKLEDRRVDAVGKYRNNDVEAYRAEISDHVPIKLVIDLKTKGSRVQLWNTQENN